MRSFVVAFVLIAFPSSAAAAYVGSLSLLTRLGASTHAGCNANFDAACSISSSATKNVVLAAAIKSAGSMLEVRRVFADVAAGRYGAPVSMHVANGTEYYPEVWAYNDTCMTTKCSLLDVDTIAALKAKATAGGGPIGYTMNGDAHVGMVQTVTDPEGTEYFVLSKYKQLPTNILPCDRAYGSTCATYNTLALAGRIYSAIMVSDSLTDTFAEISSNTAFTIGYNNYFYGWVYDAAGNAVAHGHGGVGRVLPEDLKLNRFEAANQGGGYVDYNSSTWTTTTTADIYGANGTTGSYVLPIYDADGAVTHVVGVSYSRIANIHQCEETYQTELLVTMIFCCILLLLLIILVSVAGVNRVRHGYWALTTVPERSDMGGPEPESYSENAVVDETSPNPFVPTAPTALTTMEVEAASEKPDGGNAAV